MDEASINPEILLPDVAVEPEPCTSTSNAVAEKKARTQKTRPTDLISEFVAPEELASAVSLQRELRKLHFDNPGEAMIEGMKLPIKFTPTRPKRRVAARAIVNQQYKPYHDRQGKLVMANGKVIDLCDCLDADCPGCHTPCRKCGSQKCSFQCRCNRNAIIEEVQIPGTDRLYKNNFISNTVQP